MATEMHFLRDQIDKKNYIIRSLFILKSASHENNDCRNCRNLKCKNHVNNVSEDVTPRSPNKNKPTRTDSTLRKPFIYDNTVKGDNRLNTDSDSNYSTPADIFNQNNTNEPAHRPNKCINNNINTPTLLGIADPILKDQGT